MHPTPHPESFLTILSSIKFPPVMHTDIALTHAINHAGHLQDCGVADKYGLLIQMEAGS